MKVDIFPEVILEISRRTKIVNSFGILCITLWRSTAHATRDDEDT